MHRSFSFSVWMMCGSVFDKRPAYSFSSIISETMLHFFQFPLFGQNPRRTSARWAPDATHRRFRE